MKLKTHGIQSRIMEIVETTSLTLLSFLISVCLVFMANLATARAADAEASTIAEVDSPVQSAQTRGDDLGVDKTNTQTLSSKSSIAKNSLKLKITKVKRGEGVMILAFHSSARTFLKKGEAFLPFRIVRVPVQSKADLDLTVEDLPQGTYAIAVFHDLNENDELDTNFIGVPKEPYGFSVSSGKFLPPSFEKASFEVGIQDQNELHIPLKTAI